MSVGTHDVLGDAGWDDSDTGSSAAQIRRLTQRMDRLVEHLREHRKDHAGQRGLLMLVHKRRRLIKSWAGLAKK